MNVVKLVKGLSKLGKIIPDQAAEIVSKFSKRFPTIPIDLKDGKIIFKLADEVTDLDDVLKLLRNNDFVTAFKKIMDEKTFNVIENSIGNTQFDKVLRNLPEVQILKQLPDRTVFKGVSSPLTEIQFNALLKTNPKILRAVKNISHKLHKRKLFSRFTGVAIIAGISGTIFALIQNHANKMSGCYLVSTDNSGVITKCKVRHKSCGVCANGYSEIFCKNEGVSHCLDNQKRCCEDCKDDFEVILNESSESTDTKNNQTELPKVEIAIQQKSVSYECIEMDFLDATIDLMDKSLENVFSLSEKLIYVGKIIIFIIVIFCIFYYGKKIYENRKMKDEVINNL